MTKTAETDLFVGSVTGRYALGRQVCLIGTNVFACRLRSISTQSYTVAAPVIGKIGNRITAGFGPFGILHGRVARHAMDGFAVDIEVSAVEAAELAGKIGAFRDRLWTGLLDKRAEKRFMPGDPRSTITLPDGTFLPCLIVDYSAAGVAVSAQITPNVGDAVTIGQVAGSVVRLFDVGFAVHFDAVQNADQIEDMLGAPEEWRDAIAVLRTNRINTSDPRDVFDLVGYAY
jgi:hypothetical protein